MEANKENEKSTPVDRKIDNKKPEGRTTTDNELKAGSNEVINPQAESDMINNTGADKQEPAGDADAASG